MKTKKQNGIVKAQMRFNLALFNLFDFIMSKLDKIKTKKTIRNLFFPFCFFVFFALPAQADYTQNLNVTGGSSYTNTGGNSQVAQSFFPTVSNINRVAISCGKNYGVPGAIGYIAICKGVPNPTNFSVQGSYLPCDGVGNILIATSSVQQLYCNYGNSATNFDIPPSRLIINNHYFWEFLSTSTMVNNDITAVTNCSGSGCTGQAYSYNSGNSSAVDFRFTTYYDSTQSDVLLSIVSPLNNTVVISSTSINFNGYVQNGTGLQIFAGTPNSSPGITLFGASFESSGTYYYNFNKTLANGNYWIWYYLSKGTSTLISTTTLSVEQNRGALRRTIKMDEATICAGVDTTTFFGGIECGFKKVVAWAIYPSPEMEVDMQVSYDNFKQAFPFNAFFQLTDTITRTMASTTVNSSGTFDVPMINKQGHIITIPVVSSSSMGRAIGTTNASLIRNTMTWLMWFALAFLVFIQFKKF